MLEGRNRIFPSVIFISILIFDGIRESCALHCYECSDTFKTIWRPDDCQTNVTAIPTRLCNYKQDFCFVRRVTVKGIVIEIFRDCAEECRYGCEATSFGITKITCVSCCDTDNCNTGNNAPSRISFPFSNTFGNGGGGHLVFIMMMMSCAISTITRSVLL